MTTRLGCLWSPHLRVLPGSPADPHDWLDARCRVDRIGVPLLADFAPDAVMPWSTLTYAQHFAEAEAREREQILCFDVLAPGSMDAGRGGIGFHRNTPDLDVAKFVHRVKAVKDWLGGRVQLVRGVQGGNENDFAPRMDSRWDEWLSFHVAVAVALREEFPDVRLYSAGHKLEASAFGHLTLNEDAAERGLHESQGMVFDVHWNGQTLADCEAGVNSFRARHGAVDIACLENTARATKAAYAALAMRLGLTDYVDFCGEFISETWGHNQGIDTRSLAVVNRSGGKWVWSGPNGGAVTEASQVLGELRTGDDGQDDGQDDPPADDLNVPAARAKIRDLLDQVDQAREKDNVKKGAARAIRRHARQALAHLEAGAQDQPPVPPPDEDDPPVDPPGERTDYAAVVALLIDHSGTQLIRPKTSNGPAKWVAVGPRSRAGEGVEVGDDSHGRGTTIRLAVAEYEARMAHPLGSGSRSLTESERVLVDWYDVMSAAQGPTSVWHEASPKSYHGDYYRPGKGAVHSPRLGSLAAALEFLRAELG